MDEDDDVNGCDVRYDLRQVHVDFAILLRAGEILALDQAFYSLFDDHRRWQESSAQLRRHIGHEQIVLL